MKKILTLAAAVVLCGSMAFAQVQKSANPQRISTNNKTVNQNDRKSVVKDNQINKDAKGYTYTVKEMTTDTKGITDAKIKLVYANNDQLKAIISTSYKSTFKGSYVIYDVKDMAISKNPVKSNTQIIDMKSFQPGEYRVQFVDTKGCEMNFKVIKK